MLFDELNEEQQAQVCDWYREQHEDDWYEEVLAEALDILNSATGLNVDADEVGFSFSEERANADIVRQYISADSFDVFCGGLDQFVERVIAETDVAQLEPSDVEQVQSALIDAVEGNAVIIGELTNTSCDLAFDEDDLLDPLTVLVDDGVLTDDQLTQVCEAFDEQAVLMCDALGEIGMKSMTTMYSMLDKAWDEEMSDAAIAQIARDNKWDYEESEFDAVEEEADSEEAESAEDDVYTDNPAAWADKQLGKRVVALKK